MLKMNHFSASLTNCFYGVRQLGNSWNLTWKCSNISETERNLHIGSDEYFLDLGMIYDPGLIKKQDGGEIPIGRHWNMVSLWTQFRHILSSYQLPRSNSFVAYKSYNTSVQLFWTFEGFNISSTSACVHFCLF